MKPNTKILGWRKLSALFVIYALGWYVVVFGRLDSAGNIQDIPPSVVDITKWATTLFFGVNGVIAGTRAITDVVGKFAKKGEE